MRNIFKVLSLLWISHAASASVVYGVANIPGKHAHVHYPVYVQMGSFSSMHNAHQLKKDLQTRTHAVVAIQAIAKSYKVMVGPFHSVSSLQAFAAAMATRHPKLYQHMPLKPVAATTTPIHHVTHVSVIKPAALPVVKLPIQPVASNKAPMPVLQTSVLSRIVKQGSHPEVSVFLGGSYIPNTIHGQTLQILPDEIGEYADTFTNQSSAGAFTWGVGAQYRFKLHEPSYQKHLLDSLGVGFNLYQITDFNQSGNVLQFGLSEFDNYTYTLSLNNLRLMADFDVDFQPIGQYITPFIEGGIGGARTVVSYNSAPIAPVISPNFILPNEVNWHFAYQAGAGVKYVTKSHLAFSLRYLYANMGKVHSSITGDSGTLATPLAVNMSTQNFLFGLTYLVE